MTETETLISIVTLTNLSHDGDLMSNHQMILRKTKKTKKTKQEKKRENKHFY